MGDMHRCGVEADFKLRCLITVIAHKLTSRIDVSSGTIDDIFEVLGRTLSMIRHIPYTF